MYGRSGLPNDNCKHENTVAVAIDHMTWHCPVCNKYLTSKEAGKANKKRKDEYGFAQQ